MDDILRQIRCFINRPRKQYNLIKNLPYWSQLCSSLDAIEDTKLAIDSYVAIESENDEGRLYLLVYGLFQALFVQQYAVKHLCEALEISVNHSEYPKLQDVIDVRNKSIGHPTKKQRPKGVHSYHHISRITLTLKGFDLLTYFHDGKSETKHISIEECITDQDKYLKDILSAVIETLKREEREHKEKFMSEKLIDCFPADIQYHLGKIYEAANLDCSTRRTMATVTINTIQKAIDAFKEALAKRGTDLDAYDLVKLEFEYTQYPLGKLKEHFTCLKEGRPTMMTQPDMRVYNDSLKQHILELKSMAESIDEEYSDLSDE